MSNLRSDCHEIARDLEPGVIRSHMDALCNQIDLVEEYWHAAERHRQAAERGLLQLASLKTEDVSEEDVEAVEGLMGMGHGAWDMENPQELVAACCRQMVTKVQTPTRPATYPHVHVRSLGDG